MVSKSSTSTVKTITADVSTRKTHSACFMIMQQQFLLAAVVLTLKMLAICHSLVLDYIPPVKNRTTEHASTVIMPIWWGMLTWLQLTVQSILSCAGPRVAALLLPSRCCQNLLCRRPRSTISRAQMACSMYTFPCTTNIHILITHSENLSTRCMSCATPDIPALICLILGSNMITSLCTISGRGKEGVRLSLLTEPLSSMDTISAERETDLLSACFIC